MEDNGLKELYRHIERSDKVLLGIGEDFQYDWGALTHDQRYQEIEAEIDAREEYLWITPFIQKMALQQNKEDKWKKAYYNLNKMLAGRDYFVVSLCMDDYIYTAGFDEERIVTPCGGFRRMQCDHNCCRELSDIPQDSYEAVMRYYRREIPIEALQEPSCIKCGAKLRFNQLGVTRYAEEGYLSRWNAYTRWLQGTVNRQLCVLELGVGMAYPTIIRFPFEKVVYYNQKAFMYCIHPKLYQVSEEIDGRGVGIQANAVDYLGSGYCMKACTSDSA